MTTRQVGVLMALFCAGQPAFANPWEWGDRIRGEGPVKEEQRPVRGIEAVELGTIGTLFIEQGDSVSLSVVAEENLLEYLETEVRSGMLTIRSRRHVNLSPSEPIEYHLTLPRLEELILSSSGDAELSDWKADRLLIELESSGDLDCATLLCPQLDLSLESSGDITVNSWEGDFLRARMSSSGDLKIRGGKARELDIQISSSGDFHAPQLDCLEASVRISSSGDAVLRVAEFLKARTSSSGDVIYYGDPRVEARASSSGDVVHRGT